MGRAGRQPNAVRWRCEPAYYCTRTCGLNLFSSSWSSVLSNLFSFALLSRRLPPTRAPATHARFATPPPRCPAKDDTDSSAAPAAPPRPPPPRINNNSSNPQRPSRPLRRQHRPARPDPRRSRSVLPSDHAPARSSLTLRVSRPRLRDLPACLPRSLLSQLLHARQVAPHRHRHPLPRPRGRPPRQAQARTPHPTHS